MKATIDTYSGPTDRLIFAIFSLPFRVWSNVHITFAFLSRYFLNMSRA